MNLVSIFQVEDQRMEASDTGKGFSVKSAYVFDEGKLLGRSLLVGE